MGTDIENEQEKIRATKIYRVSEIIRERAGARNSRSDR
jgi:hypothetical protein